jgi:hypothetical protein
VQAIAFGDLYLADIRAYREKQLEGTPFRPAVPLVAGSHTPVGHPDDGLRTARQDHLCRPKRFATGVRWARL